MSLPLPALDGRLALKGLLGQGGMGQVHRAWDAMLDRAVAVKFVHGDNPKEAAHLLLEARLQARVEHPHVVRVHEIGTLEGRPCIVMQMVEGGTLAGLGPEVPLALRIELLREAALGLHAAHLQGLIHRDMKPGNVLVEVSEAGQRHALVSDFGLARDEEMNPFRSGPVPILAQGADRPPAEESGITRALISHAGTLDFMAPEILLGTGPVDFRVDIYALGATAYALVSGHLPFRDGTASQLSPVSSRTHLGHDGSAQILQRILGSGPLPLVGVPEDLRTIIAKAMEKAPGDRYASAEAFAEDLGRFQRGEPILARPATGFDRLLKWGRRNPTAARASITALLTLFLGLGYGFWATRRAARLSLEAARLGALAESMEAQLRMENLAPAHDLSPVLGRIRREAEALAAQAPRSGPAAFALGRARELLGDWTASRAAYQQAWDQGYRPPATAEALGLAMIRVYDLELRRARATLAPTALEARQAGLDRTLLTPARSLLDLAPGQGWRRHWGEALLAMLRRDFDAARGHAAALRQEDPQRYEAWTLEGEIRLVEAGRRAMENRPGDAQAALDLAGPALERAMAWGRSDNRPRAAMASLHRQRAIGLQSAGRDPQPETRAALDWIRQAQALTPDHPDLLLQLSGAFHRQAMSNQTGTLSDRIRLVEDAIQAAETADRLRPDQTAPQLALADLYRGLAFLQRGQGVDSRPALAKGFDRLRRAEALAPQDPETPRNEIALRGEEAALLRAEGKDAEPILRLGWQAAQRSLRLETINDLPTRAWALGIQVELGREAWRHGRDPRPELMAAARAAEELAQAASGNVNLVDLAIGTLWTAGDQLTDLEADVPGLVARAHAALDRAQAASPGYRPFFLLRCKLHMLDAYWRGIHDLDPSEPIRAGRRESERNRAITAGMTMPSEIEAVFALMAARWELHLGRDPEAALRAAERLLTPIAKGQASSNAGLNQNLALVALVRGQWARRQHRSAEPQVQKGLACIAVAIRLDPGDPALRVVEARLHALAGDRAAVARSLESAWKLNPLIEQGAEYRKALQERP